jgi:hypothetical protein
LKLRTRAPWAVTVVIFWASLIACGDPGSLPGPSASATGSAASASASPARTETPDDKIGNQDNHASNGAPQNVVDILNKTPGRVRVRANIQLNRIKSDSVTPLNAAIAVGQECTGCQTIAVALQLDLYQKGARIVSPENYAIALNVRCSKCVTIAHAVQYALPVDDPEDDNNDGQDAKSAKELLRRMQKELDAIARDRNVTVDQAEQRVAAVIAQFNLLASGLQQDVKRSDEENSPSPSPRPSPSPSGSPTSTPALTPTKTPTGSPAPTPTR